MRNILTGTHFKKTTGAAALAAILFATACEEDDEGNWCSPLVPKIETGLTYTTRQVFDLRTQQWATTTLKMDVISPGCNTGGPRPLVVYFHGRGEPYAHSEPKQKKLKQLARDYNCVVASVDYTSMIRLGTDAEGRDVGAYLVKIPECAPNDFGYHDANEKSRLLYFMLRQGKDAVKYLKSRFREFNIDTSRVFAAGFSLGGYIAAGLGYINREADIPAGCGPLPPVTYTGDQFPNISPGSGITFPLVVPRPGLGGIDGDLQNGFSATVRGVILFNSGLPDAGIIDRNEAPLFSFHNSNDGVLALLNSRAANPCYNESPLQLQPQITARAAAQGFVEGLTLFTRTAAGAAHDFNDPDVTAAGNFIRAQQ